MRIEWVREDNITYLITDKQDFQCRAMWSVESKGHVKRLPPARGGRRLLVPTCMGSAAHRATSIAMHAADRTNWHVKRMYVEEDEVRSHMGSCSPSHTCMHHRTVVVAIEG